MGIRRTPFASDARPLPFVPVDEPAWVLRLNLAAFLGGEAVGSSPVSDWGSKLENASLVEGKLRRAAVNAMAGSERDRIDRHARDPPLIMTSTPRQRTSTNSISSWTASQWWKCIAALPRHIYCLKRAVSVQSADARPNNMKVMPS